MSAVRGAGEGAGQADGGVGGPGQATPAPPRLLGEDGAVADADMAVATALVAEQESVTANPAASPLQEPTLLDLPKGMADGPVDHGWAPAALAARRTPPSPLNWVAGGLALLLLGWLVLSAAAFVQDQFGRSALNGGITLAVFGAGLAAVLRGAWMELASYRRLQGVDRLRAALAREEGPVEPVRRLALGWLDRLDHLPEAAVARPAVTAAPNLVALRVVLRNHLDAPLRGAARRLGNRAALEGGVIVAISPSPALDGVLAGLRGLSLLRQVASLHGLRPGGAVTLALLRRLAWTAAGTSGIDLLGQTLADGALAHVPVIRQLAAALPGSGLTAIRLRRLADITAQACSPLSHR